MNLKEWLLSIISTKKHTRVAEKIDLDKSNCKRKINNLVKKAAELETIADILGMEIIIQEKTK